MLQNNKTFYKSKLIDLLYSLEGSELKALTKYIKFNSRNLDTIKLLDYFKTYFKNIERVKENNSPFDEKKSLRKDIMTRKLKYTPEKLQLESVKLSNHIQDFMVQLELKKKDNEINKQLTLLKAYRNRQLDKYLFQQVNHIQRLLDERNMRDSTYHYLKSQLYQEAFFHPSISTLPKNEQAKIFNTFQQMERHWDMAYLLAKARFYYTNKTWGQIANVKVKNAFMAILEVFERYEYKIDSPVIDIYKVAVELIINAEYNQEYNDYEQLKNQVKKYQSYVSPLERLELLELLINYSNLKSYHNNEKNEKINKRFLRESWLLYRYGIRNKILLPYGFLSEQHFNNIISLGIQYEQNEFEWVQKFLIDYQNLVTSKERNNVVALANSTLFFRESELISNRNEIKELLLKARITIRDIKFNTYEYKLRTKGLEIKISYELQDWELLENQLNAFSRFLSLNETKIPQWLITKDKNFVKIVKKLLSIQLEINYVPKVKLETKLRKLKIDAKNSIISHKKWITEKLEELEVVIENLKD